MPMSGIKRLKRQAGRYGLVDGIPFKLPVDSEKTSALMAVFPINADKARAFLPGNEVHPLKLWKKGLLVITVVDYERTDIGRYIEFSIAIACTHGPRAAPPILPLLLQGQFDVGQFVVDLPVSTEISVKGGKGIWGMPKHQANLDFKVQEGTVSSQYDLDGQFAVKIEIDKPALTPLPIRVGAANFCAFRGMLMKSNIYFQGKAGVTVLKKGAARLEIGKQPRVARLKDLEIEPNPLFTAFIPQATGMLDDHFESWFLTYDSPPASVPEGLESVVNLGQGKDWLPPPNQHAESASRAAVSALDEAWTAP